MAIPHAASGDLIDVRPLGDRLKQAVSTTLVRADHLEVVRLVLPAGRTMAEHTAAGAITIQCIEGQIEFEAHGKTQTLRGGDMVYLADAVPHAVRTTCDSSLLLTLLLHRA